MQSLSIIDKMAESHTTTREDLCTLYAIIYRSLVLTKNKAIAMMSGKKNEKEEATTRTAIAMMSGKKNEKEEATTRTPWAWVKAVNDIVTNGPWDPADGRLPVQLLPWLWLSNQKQAQNANVLMQLGITHVLSTNALEDHVLQYMRDQCQRVGVQHHFVEGYDEEKYDMIGNHWDECLAILQQVQSTGGRIMVHCAAGTNRSGLIACAAIMLFERRPVLEAVKFAKQRRGMLLTNLSFQRQLCELAAREELLGTKPKGYTDTPVPYY